MVLNKSQNRTLMEVVTVLVDMIITAVATMPLLHNNSNRVTDSHNSRVMDNLNLRVDMVDNRLHNSNHLMHNHSNRDNTPSQKSTSMKMRYHFRRQIWQREENLKRDIVNIVNQKLSISTTKI
jgi:hypothetical protein